MSSIFAWWWEDLDPDLGGPNTYESYGSGTGSLKYFLIRYTGYDACRAVPKRGMFFFLRELVLNGSWSSASCRPQFLKSVACRWFQESPNVRTCYIHFLLSFLVESNPGVIKEYFDRKTRLGRQKIPEEIEKKLQLYVNMHSVLEKV